MSVSVSLSASSASSSASSSFPFVFSALSGPSFFPRVRVHSTPTCSAACASKRRVLASCLSTRLTRCSQAPTCNLSKPIYRSSSTLQSRVPSANSSPSPSSASLRTLRRFCLLSTDPSDVPHDPFSSSWAFFSRLASCEHSGTLFHYHDQGKQMNTQSVRTGVIVHIKG